MSWRTALLQKTKNDSILFLFVVDSICITKKWNSIFASDNEFRFRLIFFKENSQMFQIRDFIFITFEAHLVIVVIIYYFEAEVIIVIVYHFEADVVAEVAESCSNLFPLQLFLLLHQLHIYHVF